MAPLIKRLANYTPARRLGAESEVSAAMVFLLSPAAAFISGSCLRVDGAAPNANVDHQRHAGGLECLLANTSEGSPHKSMTLICLPMKTKGVSIAKSA